jgi:DNA replication protein DnaC
MLNHPTLNLLNELGLAGMARGFQTLDAQPQSQSLDHAEWLGLLLEQEVTLRRQKRFEVRTKAARLRHDACIEDVDYHAARGLDRGLFLRLGSYHRVPRLFANLALARGDGRFPKVIRGLARADLLILDDWGPEPLTPDQRRDLLEIVEDRYDAGSILITSQIPVDRWYELVGNPTLADAILDRLVHNAYRLELSGDSLRKNRAPAPDA